MQGTRYTWHSPLESARANGNAGCRETETGGSHLTIQWSIVDVVCSPWFVRSSFFTPVPLSRFPSSSFFWSRSPARSSLPTPSHFSFAHHSVSSIASPYNVAGCALWLLQLGGFVVTYRRTGAV